MSEPKLPNLELVVYKAKQILGKDEEFLKALTEKRKTQKYVFTDFDVTVFSQVWGSTCTGFDITKDGEPIVAGSAMTKEYTVIVHERQTDCYCIFFGENPCYKVTNANDNFREDFFKRNMASLSQAKKRY